MATLLDLPHVKHVGTFGLFHRYRLARRRGYDDLRTLLTETYEAIPEEAL